MNIFYTYNHSNELIENNLTRALVVTLSIISKKLSNIFIKSMHDDFKRFDFSDAKFALQNNIEESPLDFANKLILAIATNDIIIDEQVYLSIDESLIKSVLETKKVPDTANDHEKKFLVDLTYGSIPDAWIYDRKSNVCILIECKVREDNIYMSQIIRHAYENYKISKISHILSITKKVSWTEIIKCIISLIKSNVANDQEKLILKHLLQYLGFFGYTQFTGVHFKELPLLKFRIDFETKRKLFNFNELLSYPYFTLNINN